MCVTPVACRYFLGTRADGPVGKRVEHVIDRLADGYASTLRRVLPLRWLDRRRRARARRRRGARRGAPAEHVLPRDRRVDGARSTCASRRACRSRTAARMTRRDGQDARRASCRKGTVELVLANVGTPQNARARDDQPELGPAHGLHPRSRSPIPRSATLSQREIADASRAILDARLPRRRVPAVRRAASSRASSPTATSRRSSSRCAATTSRQLDEQARAVAEVARTVPGVRDVRASLQTRLPRGPRRHRSREGRPRRRRRRATRRRRRSTRRSATSTRRASGSTPTTASRTTSSPATTHARVADPQALARAAGARRRRRAARSRSAPTAASAASAGPIAIERNQLQRAAHVLMQTEGRDIGTVAADLERALARDPRTAHVTVRLRRSGRADAHDLLAASASRSGSR